MNISIKPPSMWEAFNWFSTCENYTIIDVIKKREITIMDSEIKRCIKTEHFFVVLFGTSKINMIRTKTLPDQLKTFNLESSSYFSAVSLPLKVLLTYKSLTLFYIIALTLFYIVIVTTKHFIHYDIHHVYYFAYAFTFLYPPIHCLLFAKKTAHSFLEKLMYSETFFFYVFTLSLFIHDWVSGKF